MKVYTAPGSGGGASDHGALTGLSDDDHSQYALLAGRATGQTLIGGTASGDDLTLKSTSDATKGYIFFGTDSIYDEAKDYLGIGVTTPSSKIHGVASSTAVASVNIAAATLLQTGSPGGTSSAAMRALDAQAFFSGTNAFTLNTLAGARMFAVNSNDADGTGGVVTNLQGIALQAINGPILSQGGTAYSANLTGAVFQAVQNSNTGTTIAGVIGGNFNTAASGSAPVTAVTSALFGYGQAAGTVTTYRGAWLRTSSVFGNSFTGGTTTTAYAMDIEGWPTGGTTFTNTPEQLHLQAGTTAAIAIRQLGASNTNRLQGNTRIGADTAPTVALDVTGAALISTTLGVTGLTTLSGAAGITGDLTMTTGEVILAAGTTTISPLKFTSGSNTTTAEAGGMGYDGKVFYASPVTSGIGVIPAVQFISNTASVAIATNTTALQSPFSANNDVITVSASTTYFFKALIQITGMSATGRLTGTGIGGTATYTNISYQSRLDTGVANTAHTTQSAALNNAATNLNINASNAATAAETIEMYGMVRVNGAGTLIPQISHSQILGSTANCIQGSYFMIWPAGSNTVGGVGNIS